MKHLFFFYLASLLTSYTAQDVISYPYNPDSDNDQVIAVSDILSTVAVFGSDFVPSEIEIEQVPLSEVISQLLANQLELQETVVLQQEYISQLQQFVSINDSTILISGANLQVVSGAGSTSSGVNGTGNIIVGYDEDNYFQSANKSGSHNLVIGSGHTYSSFGGMVVGFGSEITGEYSSVSGGRENSLSLIHI